MLTKEEGEYMGKKVVTATGSDAISKYLCKLEYEVIEDISYQDGVLEFIKKEFADVLILASTLPGEYDKYIFIDKIREIDSKLKIIIIVDKLEDNYKSFLYSKGILDIFIDGKSSMEDMIMAINTNGYIAPESNLRQEKTISIKQCVKNEENGFKSNLTLKFQRQQIITFVGVGSPGKTTIATCFSKILAKKTKAKILLIDLDIVNASLNCFMGVKKEPKCLEYILPNDKNSSLNYMIDAIDKRHFCTNTFDKFVVKLKGIPNLDILTGNSSLYVCKNILSSEYYFRILESAKAIYDYIIIDTSGNIFLDSMQFSLLNCTKTFLVAEGNYVSLEKNVRLLLELFPVWGVMNKKIQVIINKYSGKSLDKMIIEEMLKDYPIAGYIKYSDEYEDIINSTNKKLSLELEEQYFPILENLEVLEGQSLKKHRIKKNILSLKMRLYKKLFNRSEEVC